MVSSSIIQKKEHQMTPSDLDITPSTTVHDLLNAYPDLEETLIGIAPPFKKLNNPILRKSVAKVATIKNISSVGNVPLDELINKIREAVGQPSATESYEDEEYFTGKPDWYEADKVAVSITESERENVNQMTVVDILQGVQKIKKGILTRPWY
jgi:hypothetical protein